MDEKESVVAPLVSIPMRIVCSSTSSSLPVIASFTVRFSSATCVTYGLGSGPCCPTTA